MRYSDSFCVIDIDDKEINNIFKIEQSFLIKIVEF